MTSPAGPIGESDPKAGPSRDAALPALRDEFTTAGLPEAALEARLLLLAALGIGATELAINPSVRLTEAQSGRLADYARRRLDHEPVARILGEQEFWGLPFGLSPDTLVPRPDSETIVETALQLIPNKKQSLRIVDLGTGSGCLLIALLSELPSSVGLGVDCSLEAARTARSNALRNGVGDRSLFVVSDWGTALRGGFDLIVSNPPYIASAVVDGLEPEVRDHDPRRALDGGNDGLDAYRAILGQARSLLAPGGHLVLEIGFDQEDALRALARERGFAVARFATDLAGQPRCIALKPT